MLKKGALLPLWAVIYSLYTVASASIVRAETFVIETDKAGHEPTVMIPAGAVTQLSADSAESLVGYAGREIEAIRLTGDVLIRIAGSTQPIQIKADEVVLELTANSVADSAVHRRSDAAPNKLLRSTTTPSGEEDSQVFVGNVVFDLQTTDGPMEIKAHKIEHQLRIDAGA